MTSPVLVKFGAEEFTVESAGETVKPDHGHLHVMGNTDCIPTQQGIPNDETHLPPQSPHKEQSDGCQRNNSLSIHFTHTLDCRPEYGCGRRASGGGERRSGGLARIAMRVVAILAGARPEFSVGGTVGILIVFAILGIIAAFPYPIVQRWLPGPSAVKGLCYGMLLAALICILWFYGF